MTFTFQAKAPSSVGDKTWVTQAWQSTFFLSGSFSLETSNPLVQVDTSCPATFPNGGTVTAPPGTKLEVVPNNTINCDAAYDGTFPGFAGTVQITPDPEGSGPILVTFDDPNGAAHLGAPFCKGMGSEGPHVVILTFPEDSCASENPTPPCIDKQFIDEGGHLVTKLLMDSVDPPVRH